MRRKIPSLQALMCLQAAARHESYTRAAQELALTQGAVSRQIAALEDFVGFTLFRRTRHGVALTEQGRAYAELIAPRLDALEQDTWDAMRQQGRSQSLQLASMATFATRWLIPRLPALQQAHPELMVHIETRTRPFLFADTLFDVALFAGTPEQARNWAGTRATHLFDEEVVPVCSPSWLQRGQTLSAQAMADLPLLQQSTRPLGWRQWFDAQGVDAPQALHGPRLELFSMTAAAAACGMGLALLPRFLIEAELAQGALVIAHPQGLRGQRAYYLISPERDDERAALGLFRSWLGTAVRPPTSL
jgi:DNA-binding transcriptional LysR family regulator